MNLLKVAKDAMQYVLEAMGRIFTPPEDDCPDIGVQPFEGDPMPHGKSGL